MLPIGFQFSQGSLQDFVDCPRRFQLRYVQSQTWPAVEAEPLLEVERHLERGARFHRMVERHQLGFDPALVASMAAGDAELAGWWQSYLRFGYLHTLGGRRLPEFTLSMSLAGFRLVATFDLLVVFDDRVVIFDWKTYRRDPGRAWLAARLQTRVYPYVLACAGRGLLGGSLGVEQVSMVYWLACSPAEPVVFPYSAARFAEDEAYLRDVLARLRELLGSGGEWPLVLDERVCRLCAYRSLCDRGVSAGLVNDLGEVSLESVGFGLGDVFEVGF